MQVLLVNARRSSYSGESISAPQLGLLSLAATLREGTFHDTKGTDVRFIDDQLFVLQRPLATPNEFLRGHHPDIVGIQVLTSSLKNGIKLGAESRRHHPNALVVYGGVGATPLARKLVEDGSADVVVKGEGEVTFSHLVHEYGNNGRKNLRKVRGIVFRDDDGTVVETPAAPQVMRLDKLPKPARDLADMQLYNQISRGRSGNLVTSRGCSYACAYCYSKHQWGVGQRRRQRGPGDRGDPRAGRGPWVRPDPHRGRRLRRGRPAHAGAVPEHREVRSAGQVRVGGQGPSGPHRRRHGAYAARLRLLPAAGRCRDPRLVAAEAARPSRSRST